MEPARFNRLSRLERWLEKRYRRAYEACDVARGLPYDLLGMVHTKLNARVAGKLIACIAIAALLISAGRTASACSIGDIKITQAELVRKSPSYSIVAGELVNGCDEATGVLLHTTLRDSAGKVVSTDDAWPAGVHNISPRSSYAFTLNADEPRPAASLQVDVTEVRKW